MTTTETPKRPRGRPRKNPLPEPVVEPIVDAANHGEEGEDFSELEVQQMLEQQDREGAGLPDAESAALVDDVVPWQRGEPHALDLSPVNSKIVVTSEGAVLATPQGVTTLPKSDPASKLPVGARIIRGDLTTFIASQLSSTVFVPPKNYRTAREAIADFIPHFHARKAE